MVQWKNINYLLNKCYNKMKINSWLRYTKTVMNVAQIINNETDSVEVYYSNATAGLRTFLSHYK